MVTLGTSSLEVTAAPCPYLLPGGLPRLVSPLPTLVLQVLPLPPLLPRPRPCLTVSRQATLRNHSPNGQWALPWQEIGSSLVTPS